MYDTIYALSTVYGKSGVAVIRISGNNAALVLQSLNVKCPKPRQASFKTIYSNGKALDECLVIYFKAPHSFTGEDIVEIQCHGSKAVVKGLLSHLSQNQDCRQANAGEFSRRAFDNGKMTLTEIEGLADLIDAESAAQQEQAIRQLKGKLGKIYDDWREQLITAMSHLEAYIDFPEEDLPTDLVDRFNNDILQLISQINDHTNDQQVGEKLREGAYAAIIGLPNTGKSTLINALVQRDAAIISDIAGTTRDVVEVNLDIKGYPLTLADTAGLRESQDTIEKLGIEKARKKADEADIILYLADSQQPDYTELDSFLDKNSHKNVIILANKADLQPNFEQKQYKSIPILGISAKNGLGLDHLKTKLGDMLIDIFKNVENPTITRARYREHLTNTLTSLEAISLSEDSIEISAEKFRIAINHLGQINGQIDVEEVLDKIFSSFCIGK